MQKQIRGLCITNVKTAKQAIKIMNICENIKVPNTNQAETRTIEANLERNGNKVFDSNAQIRFMYAWTWEEPGPELTTMTYKQFLKEYGKKKKKKTSRRYIYTIEGGTSGDKGLPPKETGYITQRKNENTIQMAQRLVEKGKKVLGWEHTVIIMLVKNKEKQ